MAILLNDDELFALRGLPHAAVCLYMAIRQCMDMATGMVGIKSMVSWQGFRESLYIEPSQNRQDSGSMHESKVRRLAGVLERSGLVANCSSISNRQLIFKCRLASHDKSAQNKSDRQSDRPSKASKPSTARVVQFTHKESDRQSDTHPSLEIYPVDKVSSSERVERESDDDDFTSEIQTQNPTPPPLIYPPRTEDWQQRMQTMLANIPRADAQMLLDELAGQMRAGRVSKPLGYFSKMLENYLRGDFRGELAAGEARIRTQREQDIQRRLEEQAKPVYQRNVEVAQQALAAIKAMKRGASV